MKPSIDARLFSGRVFVPPDEEAGDENRGDVAPEWQDIEFRLAHSRLDLYSSFRLLQQRYVAAGLSAGKQPIRVENFHFWRQSQVCVAIKSGRIVGCLTLVRPGPFGLPSEHSHPEVLGAVPAGAAVGEVTSFAISNDCGLHSLDIFLGLTQLVQRFGLFNEVEYFFAVVHPRHAKFYQRAIGFKVISDEVPCERVEGSPGVALMVKLDESELCRPQWRNAFTPEGGRALEDLRPRAMTESQKRFFSQYLAPSDFRRAA